MSKQRATRLQEIVADLRDVRIESTDAFLERAVRGLAEATESDTAAAHMPWQTGGGVLVLEHAATAGAAVPTGLRERFERWLATQRTSDWAGYDPMAPAPAQRNRVLSTDEVASMVGFVPRFTSEFLPALRFRGKEQVRSLLCEGPSLLAWYGILQGEPVAPWQRAALEALAPAVRDRLALARHWAETDWLEAGLATALEALGSPAVVIDEGGRPLHGNAAGKALLDGDRRGVGEELRAARRGHPSWSAHPVTVRGEPRGHLLVSTLRATDARVSLASARWSLSPRQRQVLALLVEGYSNRAIGLELGIAVRTVEVHVGVCFDRARVASRSALVSRVLGGG